MWIAIPFLAGAALAVAAFLQERAKRRRAEHRLAQRPQLTSKQFAEMHFGESALRAALAAELRDMLGRHVPFALEGMGPDDAFVRDLRIDDFDSLASVEFLLHVEERFGIKVPDKVAKSMRTFRELVDYLALRVRGAGPPWGERRGRPTRACS